MWRNLGRVEGEQGPEGPQGPAGSGGCGYRRNEVNITSVAPDATIYQFYQSADILPMEAGSNAIVDACIISFDGTTFYRDNIRVYVSLYLDPNEELKAFAVGYYDTEKGFEWDALNWGMDFTDPTAPIFKLALKNISGNTITRYSIATVMSKVDYTI